MQSQHSPGSRPRSVLVLDDEPALTALLAKVLGDVGLEVACANDGWQALTRVRERPPGAMVVDVELPGIDGVQFIDRCRAIPECADIPVVLMSAAHVLRAVRQRIEGKGVVLLLAKPFDLDELIASITALTEPIREKR